MAGKIIILNGAPSSGKTTIAKILQDILPEPYLYVGVDAFMHMLPSRYLAYSSEDSQPEGIAFIPSNDATGQPIMKVAIGPWGEKLLRGYLNAIKALAETGNNVIADVILSEAEWQRILLDTLHGLITCVVELYAPLHELEKREKARWEAPGLARGRYEEIYSLPKDCDLFIDTSKTAAQDCALQIKQWLTTFNTN